MNTVIKDIPFNLDSDQIIKRLHISETDDIKRAKQLVEEAQHIGNPKALFRLAYIESKGEDWVAIEGCRLRSRILRINLDAVHRVFPYVATSGLELEEWAKSMGDFLERYWADTIREAVLGVAVQAVRARIQAESGLQKTSTMNPGSLEDWPLREQRQLFSLLGDTRKLIGVELTDSFLMIPIKSVSGLVFPAETSWENCQLCPRENCPGRRAPYDEELLNQKYSEK